MKPWHCAAALALAAALTACSEHTTGSVSLSLSSLQPPGTAGPAITAAGDSTLITLGNDTIILRSVELVVREVELKKVEAAECDSIADNDDCEEFETGPILVALPLGAAAATTEITVHAPVGRFDKLEFEIHKVDGGGAEAVFVAAHPGIGDISVKVTDTGGANENLVKDNIEASFEVFRDNDRDGRDDMHEGS